MSQHITGIAVNPADETIQLGPIAMHFLVTGNDSGGSAAVAEMTLGPGGKLPSPAHSHDAYEETIYGLDGGAITWTVDGAAIEVNPGQALCIPRGAVHRFDNFSGREAKCLVVATPAKIGPEYFREIFAAAKASMTAGGPPDLAKMGEIMIRHGITPARG
jgi:quercetin dioxygenase-like cupin family protein